MDDISRIPSICITSTPVHRCIKLSTLTTMVKDSIGSFVFTLLLLLSLSSTMHAAISSPKEKQGDCDYSERAKEVDALRRQNSTQGVTRKRISQFLSSPKSKSTKQTPLTRLWLGKAAQMLEGQSRWNGMSVYTQPAGPYR